MQKDELMLKVENVSKVYRLGEIGGTTLRETLQRTKAKLFGKEDPTKKIGAKNYNKGEKFKALDNISFEVKKGERIGIIGHNGAGKSTLLKLISRVTGPTDGKIYLNGRVASMLEVGTGFHPELTGRENVYMNGAILGMTKKEIDAKMEDIIEFSEVRQFIDTPVKRYSSGMYVKLAFSVAAHLDSEIVIMDEVLAVGDVAFQEKCIKKMRDISTQKGRTILYVSHNMNTIRQLCNKVLVLKNGKIEFFGDVESGIKYYYNGVSSDSSSVDLSNYKRSSLANGAIMIKHIDFNSDASITKPDCFKIKLYWESKIEITNLLVRITLVSFSDEPVSSSIVRIGGVKPFIDYETRLYLNTEILAPSEYWVNIVLFEYNSKGSEIIFDEVNYLLSFSLNDPNYLAWRTDWFGYITKIDITQQTNPSNRSGE